MQRTDIPVAMRLKQDAGWNQVEADWERLLFLEPEGCFVAEVADQPVATTIGVSLGDVGWIAGVLVDPHYRRQGIARALVTRAVEFLESRGIETIRLDATPSGRGLYEQLGFATDYEVVSFIRSPSRSAALPRTARGLSDREPSPDDQLAAMMLDRSVIHADRRRLLERLFAEPSVNSRVLVGVNGGAGFAMLRPGSLATRIGPIVACDTDRGQELADWAVGQVSGPFVVDIPEGNLVAIHWAHSIGLQPARTLTRMTRGPSRVEELDQLWASSGPEKG